MIVTLDAILALDGSVNLYMAYGGTNFGFFAGANGGGGTSYQPTITRWVLLRCSYGFTSDMAFY